MVPRPGVAAKLEIGLVGAGDIEGVLVSDDGRGFEGLDVELLDAGGQVAGVARSDFDGFFLFERVAYGSYRLRLTADSASAAGVDAAIHKTIEISAAKTVVRVGAIRIRKAARIASAEPAGGASLSPR